MRTNLRILSTVLFLFVGVFMYAQQVVSGTIQDSAGDTAPYASVINTETNVTAEADVDGKFSIQAENGQSLLITYDGKTETFKVTGPQMALKMGASTQRESAGGEVVVQVALRTKNKEEITSAVSEVNKGIVDNALAANITKSLDGAVSGLKVAQGSGQPGSAATIQIRGVASVFGTNNPLIVVDGVPFSGSLSTINNNDIESVNLLKDASATSLYGQRATGGVLIITTKRVNKGKVNVEVDSKIGVNYRLGQDYDYITDPKEYYTLWWDIIRNQRIKLGDSDNAARYYATQYLINNPTTGTNPDWGLGYNNYNVADTDLVRMDGSFNPNAQLLYHDDWQKELFKTRTTQQHYVSISGGNEVSASTLTLGYLNDNGFTIGSGFENVTARLKSDFRVFDKINVLGILGYSSAHWNFSRESAGYGNFFDFSRSVAPIYPVYQYNADGSRKYDTNGNPIYDFGSANDGFAGIRLNGVPTNPVSEYVTNLDKTKRDALDLKLNASAEIIKNLTFRYVFGSELYFNYYKSLDNPFSGDAQATNGQVSFNNTKLVNINNQQSLTYKNTFGEHGIDIFVGHENFIESSETQSATYSNLFFPDNIHIDFAGRYAGIGDNEYNYSIEGYFAEIIYNFGKKYTINSSVRRDGSSVFSPKNRWATFWAISGSWNIDKESFMQNISWVDKLRIYGGYGTTGNDFMYYNSSGNSSSPNGVRNYHLFQNQYSTLRNADDEIIPTLYYNGNPDLTYELTSAYNIGLSTELLKNKIIATFNYYNRTTDDLYYFTQLTPSGNTVNLLASNSGKVENKGFELELMGKLINRENIEWSLNLNATRNENKVLESFQGYETYEGYAGKLKGYSLNTFYLNEFAGIDSNTGLALYNVYERIFENGKWVGIGNLLGTTSDPSLATPTRKYSSDPDVYGGFGSNFRYKGIDFSIQFAYSIGGYGYDNTYAGLMAISGDRGRNFHRDAINMWSYGVNENSQIPLMFISSQNLSSTSTYFLIKNDYLSLNTISLGYTLKEDWIKQAGLSSLRLYAIAQNIAYWSKRQGYDPRQSLRGNSDENLYPLSTSLIFGVNIKF